MGWADIAGAIGSAAKTTLLTAPETPDAQKALFLGEEEANRKRENEIAKEQRAADAAQKKIDDRREYNNTQMQGVLGQTIVNPGEIRIATPTGVAELENWAAGNRPGQAGATSNAQNQNIDWATYHSQAKGGGYMETGVHSQSQIDTMSGRWKESAQKDRDAWLAGGGGFYDASKGRSWD